MARRYHWHSGHVKAFTEEPHTAVCGQNQGQILNLTHREARTTRKSILDLTAKRPVQLMSEIKKIVMPRHHEVRVDNVHLKRLGAVLTLAHERGIADFDNLLITEGLGPRTLQALTLVSEVLHGTPSRFADPARFSFAHG
ncbi:MAG: DUF763 domain-containing protein, partial [Saprospiraceae bacterium]|nr:DUF763 domain-containing protein [Saprospiraceae bacterium]